MSQYQVPQFIEVEDKIFGPLTLKQFVFIAGGGGLCLVFFTFFPLYLTILLGIPVMALSISLAFFQVNGRPLIFAMEHAFNYLIGNKLYLWKQRLTTNDQRPTTPQEEQKPTVMSVPKLSESKLKDLSWSLNIKDRAQMGITNNEPTGFEL